MPKQWGWIHGALKNINLRTGHRNLAPRESIRSLAIRVNPRHNSSMLIYSGKTYSSTLIRTAIKDVACEKCQCRFTYEMVRRGTGSGHSAYHLDNKGAEARAVTKAADALVKILIEGDDIVACPSCGWFQQEMVQKNVLPLLVLVALGRRPPHRPQPTLSKNKRELSWNSHGCGYLSRSRHHSIIGTATAGYRARKYPLDPYVSG